jgi:hypothetical protein
MQYWKAISFSNTSPVPVYFKPSDAFDIDPVLGSTALPGFAEFAGFYDRYRVVGAKIQVEAITDSLGAPVMLTFMASNRILSAVSITDFVHWRGNPLGKSKTLPSRSGPVTAIERHYSTEEVYGSKEVYYESEFSGPTTGSPVNNWYLYIVNYQFPAASATTTYVNITIEPEVEFFERKVLVN